MHHADVQAKDVQIEESLQGKFVTFLSQPPYIK